MCNFHLNIRGTPQCAIDDCIDRGIMQSGTKFISLKKKSIKSFENTSTLLEFYLDFIFKLELVLHFSPTLL